MPRSKEEDAARKRKERPVAARSVKEDVAARKRVTRSVAAQVEAHHKRTLQGEVFPLPRSKEDDASKGKPTGESNTVKGPSPPGPQL